MFGISSGWPSRAISTVITSRPPAGAAGATPAITLSSGPCRRTGCGGGASVTETRKRPRLCPRSP